MAGDVGEEQAKQAALAHLARARPDFPKGHIQSIERKGPHYVVTIMPENEMGILVFFVTFKCWVDAGTGVVVKMA